MNSDLVAPESVPQLREALQQATRVLPVGNRTKSALCRPDQASLLSLRSLRGIIEYEPSEFTFTAWAGTPLSEIRSVLCEKQQYLPFDPLLVESGATLGGTIASGLSGPGRFRYGGVRDFIIGVRFLSGDGDLVQGGGKVVKNAAGFDLPKFLVGSLGYYGIIVEASFKVFPKPLSLRTIRLPCSSHSEAMQRACTVASSRWEADAVDYRPADRSLFIRFGGPEDAMRAIGEEVLKRWPDGAVMNENEASPFWSSISELTYSPFTEPVIVKVPTTVVSYLSLQEAMNSREGAALHVSVAGGVTWIALPDSSQLAWLDDQLRRLDLAGLVVRGEITSPKIGRWQQNAMQRLVQQAIDPHGKFPGI